MSAGSALTVVSAPGKVLLTGGYLVLDRDYDGLVIGTGARFYTVIKPGELTSNGKIIVNSPQFLNATWEYSIVTTGGSFDILKKSDKHLQNRLVEIALRYSLGVIAQRITFDRFEEKIRSGLRIYILGDNDFYSQREQLGNHKLSPSISSMRLLEPFCKLNTTLKEVHKTGLGSSAAMITSLVAALFIHFNVIYVDEENEESNIYGRKLVHNVAQFCHCLAQGKIGSGFDVATAVWGSHIHRRFSPKILDPIMSKEEENIDMEDLSKIVSPESPWDNLVTPFALPPEFILLLADVDAGSDTPSMATKVLAWRKANLDQANAIWTKLGAYNKTIPDIMSQLSKLYSLDEKAYNQGILLGSQVKGSELHRLAGNNTIVNLLADVFLKFQSIRELLREMSELSDVPIEPPSQTRLLDASLEVPGVIMAGVPGAGGFDAIFCIAISSDAINGLEKVWSSWKETPVTPLLTRAASKGFAKETLEQVAGLKLLV
ncbi:hypothetical protein G9A89_017080 [Geosiphon pyriformis]|nr:hypothetical protein G9A89_017080 [Geosiphon pyriformis]